MSIKFEKNGINFQYPENWVIVEEEWDENISALTFEDDENGIFMIDIYHAGVDPDLKTYAWKHFDSFVNELPFFSKVESGPTSQECSVQDVPGMVLEFVVNICFFIKTRYINSVFRVAGASNVSFISGQYTESNSAKSRAALNNLVGSYSAN
jgi:hypothetical protein